MTRILTKATGMPASDGAGVKLSRVLGQPGLKRLDPFLMLDEFGSEDAQDYIAGFPQHPHRGFQTVTYMLEGKMGHKDSVGNSGVIEDGGLQWMNAGKGIIHEEIPQQTQGRMRGFQLWVNLPASEKMSPPGYQDIPTDKIPEVQLDNALVRVLAGTFNDVLGPVKTQAIQPQFLDVHLQADAHIKWPTVSSHNGFLYVYEGEVSVGAEILTKGQLGVLKFDGDIEVKASCESKAIFVSGEPINEPIVQYGPFVMNTEEEIHQAIRDYQSGALA
ncbi:pirin family protein [Glaciecola sp. XM2]|uniref:pirin family protein n=1 Tax=Glaciecola sp. XM2 TaxID=1914931 RepID=UPI001BDEAF9C|nr:pirin family protein [Glaciecola sp. XM2]MBT1451995.1 pirin family protein [Glaciecola sp. XM2]